MVRKYLHVRFEFTWVDTQAAAPPNTLFFIAHFFLYRNIETATKTKLFENKKKVSFLGAKISKKQFIFCHSFYVFL